MTEAEWQFKCVFQITVFASAFLLLKTRYLTQISLIRIWFLHHPLDSTFVASSCHLWRLQIFTMHPERHIQLFAFLKDLIFGEPKWFASGKHWWDESRLLVFELQVCFSLKKSAVCCIYTTCFSLYYCLQL